MKDPPPRHRVVLAIETSQRRGGVALRDASGAVHVAPLESSARHDDALMPAIDRLTTNARCRPGDVEGIAVSIGPGGFTGMRIAVTTARMVALVTGATLAAVPTAMVVAARVPPRTGPIIVVLAVKGTSLWATRLVPVGDAAPGRGTGWGLEHAARADAGDLPLDGIALLVADEFAPEVLRARCRDAGVAIIAPDFDPTACLEVGEAMLDEGIVTPPLELSPIYPRPPEAVRLWESRKSRNTPA